MRLTTAIKSGLCKATKWRIKEGTLRDSFYIKVPKSPETKELTKALFGAAEPAATYFAPGGRILAWQWRLPLNGFRNVWTAKLGQALDD